MARHRKKPTLWSNIALLVLGFGAVISLVAGISLIYIELQDGSMTSSPNNVQMTGGPSRGLY